MIFFFFYHVESQFLRTLEDNMTKQPGVKWLCLSLKLSGIYGGSYVKQLHASLGEHHMIIMRHALWKGGHSACTISIDSHQPRSADFL